MSDPNYSAIRARLRYENVEEFVDSYGRYISRRGMFLPMAASKLKPVGTTVRFQLLLADGTSAMLGEGVVRKLKGLDDASTDGPVGMLVKFSKLSPDSKKLVDRVVKEKEEAKRTIRQTQPTPGGQPAVTAEAASSATTGVLAAEQADQLVSEAGSDSEASLAETNQPDHGPRTREVELPVDDESDTMTSGDEVFGGATSQAAVDGDPAEAVAEALDSGTYEAAAQSTPSVSAETLQEESDPFAGLADEMLEGFNQSSQEQESDYLGGSADELEDDADFFSEPQEPAGDEGAASEEDVASGGADGDLQQSQEEAKEAHEPKALAQSEGGLKVMAYDESDYDEAATRDFEQFALAGEEGEVDEMFDNIFGGGGDDGLFGGGGGDDDGIDDFFGAESDGAAEEPGSEDVEEESEAGLEVDSEFVAEEEEVAQVGPPPAAEAQEASDEEGPDIPGDEEAQKDSDLDLADDDGDEEWGWTSEEDDDDDEVEDSISIREVEGDSTDHIQSLLSMDDEDDDEEPELTLNIGGGTLQEESSEVEDEPDPDDSMEMLLATAKQDLESKKEAETEEDDDRDILDELLGEDDDLPPPIAGPVPLDLPDPGQSKKKKKGFISKFFGGDD